MNVDSVYFFMLIMAASAINAVIAYVSLSTITTKAQQLVACISVFVASTMLSVYVFFAVIVLAVVSFFIKKNLKNKRKDVVI